jgi:ERF superfamily
MRAAKSKQVVNMLPASPTESERIIQPVTRSPYHPMMATALERGQVEFLERLYQLQVQWEAKEARDAFFAAMAALQAECPIIKKTKQGPKAKYAPLEDVERELKPLRAKYGFSVWFYTERRGDHLWGYATVAHKQGHKEDMGHQDIQYLHAEDTRASGATRGGMNQTQADAGTSSYLQRYILGKAFNLSFEGDDQDGVVTAAQVMQLPELIRETPHSFGQWLASTTTSPEQLTHTQASRMVQAIEKYLAATKGERSGGLQETTTTLQERN